MAKQTFTAGQVLTAAQMTTLQANDYNQTVSAKTASYVLVAADAGTTITMNAAGATTITVNTALFTAGDTLKILNIGAGVCTVTAGTATVSSSGSLALNQYDSGILYFSTTSVSIWNGAGPGDITGVTASTGLTGGGTSGTVSLAIDSTVATLTGAQTLTNKTLTTPVISSISNTGTVTIPTGTDTLVNLAGAQTLTNKTLTTPVISSISNSGTVTIPTGTDTLVNLIGTQTLQGKTLSNPVVSGISSPGTGLSSDIPGVNGSLFLYANSTSKLRILSAGPTVITGGFAPANSISAKTANFTQTLSDTFIRCTGTASITATLLAGTAGTGSTNYGTTIYITTTAAFTVVSASANIFQKTGGAATTAILPATAGAWAILVLDATIGGWVIMCSGT